MVGEIKCHFLYRSIVEMRTGRKQDFRKKTRTSRTYHAAARTVTTPFFVVARARRTSMVLLGIVGARCRHFIFGAA